MSSLAGTFLVARPALQDPNFTQTVVLVLQHDDEGAFGLVVTRPEEMEDLPFPVFAGGPCPSQGYLLLHGHPEWVEPDDAAAKAEVAPGIYLGSASCTDHVTDPPAGYTPKFRMFSGYSGWGPGQLEGELTSGAWAIVKANGKLLFDTPPADLWEKLIPPTIPQPSLN